MGFPPPYGGFFPTLVFMAAICIIAIRDFFRSLLHLIKLNHNVDSTENLWQFTAHIELHLQNKMYTLESTSEAVREFLPSSVFGMHAEQHPEREDSECAVCLCGFHQGQEIRQIPYCLHIFHKDCIDRWLDHDQNRCPLCRSSLVNEEAIMNKNQMLLNSWLSFSSEDHSPDNPSTPGA
eukprot:c19408_g1_i1 orf=584-1120(-)